MVSTRQRRVIEAFINVVRSGECSYSLAVKEMENEAAYGYLTEKAKELFYTAFSEPVTEAEV